MADRFELIAAQFAAAGYATASVTLYGDGSFGVILAADGVAVYGEVDDQGQVAPPIMPARQFKAGLAAAVRELRARPAPRPVVVQLPLWA